jgi:polyphosphate kinase 2 (PPK2 family)
MDDLVVKPGSEARLSERPTDAKLGLTDKASGQAELATLQPHLRELQDRLWAEGSRGLLVVLQAMDAGGKDGTIRTVMTGLNPAGVKVSSF